MSKASGLSMSLAKSMEVKMALNLCKGLNHFKLLIVSRFINFQETPFQAQVMSV